MKEVITKFPDIPFITIDVANGYHQNFIDFVKKVRDEFPDKTIIAGNVITAGAVEELTPGADIVMKLVLIVCTTRLMTGV